MSHRPRIRVLIADDNPDYREALAQVVERSEGLELAGAAADATEAIELAARALPDVALVDVRMPAGGGAAAVRGINERSPRTRMIALSAWDPLGLEGSGVVGRLRKGTSVADIVGAVERAAAQDTTAASPGEQSFDRPPVPTPPSADAARILQPSYAQRERIEHLLHHKVQSRVAALRIQLGLWSERVKGCETAPILDCVGAELDRVVDELRALAGEMHPSVLGPYGLTVALQALARDSMISVVAPSGRFGRLPLATEYAIYFYCADLVCLAALRLGEHAAVTVDLAERDGRIRCSVVVEGADTDLEGFSNEAARIALSDPIVALGGSIRVAPGPRPGVHVVAEIPAPARH